VKSYERLKTMFQEQEIDKPSFIKQAYDDHHKTLFEYSSVLPATNARSISIEDDVVTVTTRDRGIKLSWIPGDYRIAPPHILNFGDYEKDETQMIDRLVKDGDVVFDIGANIGWYSLNLAISRRSTQLFAFEPIPKTYACLQKNIGINQIRNVTAFNYGLADKPGEFPMYYYPEGSGNSSLSNLTERDDIQTVMCKLRTLDDVVAELDTRVNFIKCDVEGAELLVLRGGLETIKRDKPIIFAEILRKWSAKFGYKPNDIIDLLSAEGYEAFTIKGQDLASCPTIDDSTAETNFIFLDRHKHQIYIRQYQIR